MAGDGDAEPGRACVQYLVRNAGTRLRRSARCKYQKDIKEDMSGPMEFCQFKNIGG